MQGTGAFTTILRYDASSDTPTVEQLAANHAVLVYAVMPFHDGELLGNRLAAYHDQGGGVVVAAFANSKFISGGLKGAYSAVANGYALMDYSQESILYTPGELQDVLEPESPLMIGVTSFAAQAAYRSTNNVTAHAVVVAWWGDTDSDGWAPLVLRGTRGNRTLVELNFLPWSSNVGPYFWTGDGAALLRNALKYSRCMPTVSKLACEPGTFAAAGVSANFKGKGAFQDSASDTEWGLRSSCYPLQPVSMCVTFM